MGSTWNVHGICSEYVWHMHGIRIEHAWYICRGCAWPMYGLCMEQVGNSMVYVYEIYMSSLFNAMQTKRDLVKNALSVGVVFVIPH